MEKSIHIKAIDQLRGLAILLVLSNHTFGYAEVKYPMPFAHETQLNIPDLIGFSFMAVFANGFLGVMLFFVLSGFCIRWSHLNTRTFSWPAFYKRRFFRIFPAYWFWLAIAAYLANSNVKDILSHAVLAHNFSKEYFHSIYSPFWSIAIEWQIYLIYPLLILLASKIPSRILLCLVACAGIVSSFISSQFVSSLLGTDILSIFERLPTALIFSWMLGFYMAESLKKGHTIHPSPWLLVASLIVGILAYSHPYTCFLASVPWSFAAYQIVAIFLRNSKFPWFRMFDWMAWIGVVSYSVYLSHDLFAGVYPLIKNSLNLPNGSVYSGMATLATMALPLVLLGYISYRLIEIPGITLGKKLCQKRKMKAALAAQDG